MNDFTKEELTILFLELRIAIRNWGHTEDLKDYPKLKDKIQSMIDNYCDHENAKSIHPGDTVLICPKCETILSHWCLRKAKV